jgi:hypothetical protein
MNRPLTLRTLLITNGLTVLLLVAALLVTGTMAGPALQATPASTADSTTTINYQGHLTDSAGEPISGTLPMTFKLYRDPSGGTAVWTEQRSGSNAVPVTDGLFSVSLGSVTPIDISLFGEPLWLGISVNGDAEMSPRERLDGGAMAVGSRLLGEKTCDDLRSTKETLARGRHAVKCNSAQDKLEVTATTTGRPVVVHMTARYYMNPARETYCAIEVMQNGTRVEAAELDGTSTATGSHGCSGSYVFTDLPAGTYTFQVLAGVWGNGNTEVNWKHHRQIAVFEY